MNLFCDEAPAMKPTDITVHTKNGAYDISANLRLVGRDLLVAISGGTSPHIGAVAVAQPRPSLKDSNLRSATASVICLPAHKEDDLAKAAAEVLAAATNVAVVVTAGIHWDDLSPEGIVAVTENTQILLSLILEEIAKNWPFLLSTAKEDNEHS